MECQLCKHRPSLFIEEEGFSICRKEEVHLFRIKNTYFESTIDGLKDYGQCPSFELNKKGLTEFEVSMMEDIDQ